MRDRDKFASICLLLVFCLNFAPACRSSRAESVAAVPKDYTLIDEFAPTFSRILDEDADEWPDEERTEALQTRKGNLLAYVAPAFKAKLDVEGSARLRDGRVVNFDQKYDGRWTYLVTRNAPYGISARGYKLIPYRTLAVDPHVVPLGTVVYLPALDGVRLPSGEIHDGFCLTDDTGQGIDGRRIDVFVGFENDEDNTLTRSGRIADMEPVRVYRVDSETARRVRARFNS